MAAIDVDSFLTPISADDPFGPDLDLEGDLDFMNFVARIEGALPQSFLTFDRASIDYKAENAAIGALLERTRDLRLLVFHAKLAVLSRDLDGFVGDLDTVAAALETAWTDVHPRGEGGDFMMRVVSVASLDDSPTVLMPLQAIPLVENRRIGSVNWRAVQIAEGRITAREGETSPDAGSIERAFLEDDLADLVARRDRFVAIAGAVERIDAASIEHGDYENRISLERLGELARAIADHLDLHIGRRDATAALKPPHDALAVPAAEGDDDGGAGGPLVLGTAAAAPSPGAAATVASRRDALRALSAAGDYFQTYEPNSPSLLLVRFALKVANRPFHDIVRIMMPDVASRASVPVAQSMFRLSLDKLTETISGGWDASPPPEETFDADEEPSFAVATRRDALRLLDLVVAWYRVAEPASPLQLVVGRARELAERDFQTLLKELFSDNALQTLKGDEWR